MNISRVWPEKESYGDKREYRGQLCVFGTSTRACCCSGPSQMMFLWSKRKIPGEDLWYEFEKRFGNWEEDIQTTSCHWGGTARKEEQLESIQKMMKSRGRRTTRSRCSRMNRSASWLLSPWKTTLSGLAWSVDDAAMPISIRLGFCCCGLPRNICDYGQVMVRSQHASENVERTYSDSDTCG